MNLTYLGHSCFKLETKPLLVDNTKEKLAIIIDPFDEKVGPKPPSGKVDIVLSTHNHHDHNNFSKLKEFFAVTGPGEYAFKGVSIVGIPSFHDNKQGEESGQNTIYVLESEGIRLCHLGDLGHVLSQEKIEAIGNVDVLMTPIGGTYTIGPKEAVENIKAIEPRLVIPMHYADPKIKISGLESPAAFYKELGIEPEEKTKKLTLKAGSFKEDAPLEVVEMEF